MKTRHLALLSVALLLPCALRAQGTANSTGAVRVGDTVDLRITGVPAPDSAAFNGTYTIDDDGNITIPFIQKVKVQGMLPSQIQETIQARYIEEKYYTHPTVTVQENSAARFVNITGEVNSHGARIPYTADMTLMTAITAAGGFTDFADKKRVEVKRGDTVSKYNAIDISKGKASDPKVLPGDQITIRQGW